MAAAFMPAMTTMVSAGSGRSGGGVLTAWIIGKTSRFKAAATQKPVINWISEALTMDNTLFTSRYWFTKLPWEDPMSYWKRSPLSLVGTCTAKLSRSGMRKCISAR